MNRTHHLPDLMGLYLYQLLFTSELNWMHPVPYLTFALRRVGWLPPSFILDCIFLPREFLRITTVDLWAGHFSKFWYKKFMLCTFKW